MNMQLRIHQELRRRGKNLATVTQEEYDDAAIHIRTLTEKARDLAARTKSQVTVTVLRQYVPLRVLEGRESGCRANTCGSFELLAGGVEVCHRCNCSGANLHLKRRDPHQECPADPPVWTRYTGPLKEEVSGAD